MKIVRIVPCVSALLLLTVLPGCQPGHTGATAPAADSASATSEAERTHEMERKAAELDKRAEEIKTMTGSEQEKIDAVNQLDKERRELAAQAEGGH